MAKPLSEEDIKKISKLPAVKKVTEAGRIYYSEEFQEHFLEEYSAHGKPTRIFREAGLTPELIGYKRIERDRPLEGKGAEGSGGHLKRLPIIFCDFQMLMQDVIRIRDGKEAACQ